MLTNVIYACIILADNINATEKNFIFLTADMQDDMGKVFPLIDTIPWNHFGRKNVGYLYALLYGASVVWDFDDDNILLTESHSFEILPIKPKTSANNTSDAKETDSGTIDVLVPLDYKKLSFNPYPVMGCPSDPCKSTEPGS